MKILKQESVSIQRSSALVSVEIPPASPASDLTLTATAFTGGESFQRSRTLRMSPSEILSVSASVTAEPHGTGLDLRVSASDRQGKPLPGVQIVAVWRDRAAEPLWPRACWPSWIWPAPEGHGAVSLEFRSNGYSGGSAADRLEQARSELGPVEGFTPQKGVSRVPSRALHSNSAGGARLPPTDRTGQSHLTIDPADASELMIEVVAVGPVGAEGVAPVATTSVSALSPVPTVATTVPPLIRPGDRARASLRISSPTAVGLLVNGAALQLQSDHPINDSIPDSRGRTPGLRSGWAPRRSSTSTCRPPRDRPGSRAVPG